MDLRPSFISLERLCLTTYRRLVAREYSEVAILTVDKGQRQTCAGCWNETREVTIHPPRLSSHPQFVALPPAGSRARCDVLVLISDLHLTDGSTAINVDPSAFTLLGEEIAASYKDRGAREMHLVLLGDIYDLVRTD